MTATSITADNTIPFTPRPLGADSTWVGTYAYSEPADRLSNIDDRKPLVPLEVVDAAHHGDRDSLARLCTLIHPHLIGFYRYSGLTTDEAEDLFQETLARYLRSGFDPDDPTERRRYLFRIATNLARARAAQQAESLRVNARSTRALPH